MENAVVGKTAGEDVRIVEAEQVHLQDILQLLAGGAAGARVGVDTVDVGAYIGAFEAIKAAPEVTLYVALSGKEEVVGTYQLTFLKGLAYKGRPRAEVESVHTRADMRGQGIGAKMMAHAEQRARAENACLLQLTSNAQRVDAHRFYARLGFEQSHLGFKKVLKKD